MSQPVSDSDRVGYPKFVFFIQFWNLNGIRTCKYTRHNTVQFEFNLISVTDTLALDDIIFFIKEGLREN